MKRRSALLLQGTLVLVGIAALAFLLLEPHVEGRNAHATFFEIYFQDPFLAYVYMSAIPFFVALYRAFWLLEHWRKDGAFSQMTVDALCSIKHCMMIFIALVAGGIVFIVMFGDKDDRPVGIFMGFFIEALSAGTLISVAMLARSLQNSFRRMEGGLSR